MGAEAIIAPPGRLHHSLLKLSVFPLDMDFTPSCQLFGAGDGLSLGPQYCDCTLSVRFLNDPYITAGHHENVIMLVVTIVTFLSVLSRYAMRFESRNTLLSLPAQFQLVLLKRSKNGIADLAR